MKLKTALFLFVAFLITQLILFIQFKSDHNLQIQFIDVGQGDSILITTPNKQLVLVDGGPETNKNLESIIASKFYFTQCKINTIVATHPHKDHIKGLTKVLDMCNVKNIFLTKDYYESSDYLVFLQKVKAENSNVKYVETNDKFKIDNVTFTVLWPDYSVLTSDENLECPTLKTCTKPICTNIKIYNLLPNPPVNCTNPNYVSIVLKMSYKNFDTLLTGDAEELVLKKFSINSKIEVLKVPHHGAYDSLDTNLINSLNPLIAIISAGKNNVYHHPSPKVLGAFSNRKIKTLVTKDTGTITIKSDGEKFWVK